MLRAVYVVCLVPFVCGIIVKDPVSVSEEYKYSYYVDDLSSGDSKSQHELRRGDVVSGAYSVLETDGSRRTVHYSADPIYGFKPLVIQVTQPFVTPIPLQYSAITAQFHLNYPHLLLPAGDVKPSDYAEFYERRSQNSFKEGYAHNEYFKPANELVLPKKSPFNGLYFEPINKRL